MTREISVAVIGLGSRGLSVVERVLMSAARLRAAGIRVRIEIVDPTCEGTGLHRTEQPDYLLLNTTCSGVSMFPDDATVDAELARPGPSLYDWATARGLRLGADGWTVGHSGRPIRPTDFLPRRVLGQYLRWFRDMLLHSVPDNAEITLHRAQAVELAAGADDGLAFLLDTGEMVTAGYAFLTTGHLGNAPGHSGLGHRGNVVAHPYPLPDQVAVIEPGQSVAIGGFGLSAMDVLTALTAGRGGRFTEQDGRHRYLPSGQEPEVVLYSQTGTPFRARPLVNQPVPGHRPVALTAANIDQIPRGHRDFARDVLPLVLTEMRIAYHRRRAELAGDDIVPARLDAVTDAWQAGLVLDELDRRFGVFDAAAAWDGAAGMPLGDSRAYQEWVLDSIRRDLAEGVRGFAGSPVKAALDVLREHRDTIRYAVDFGGLTEESLDDFTARAVPRMNRAVVGPQYERHADLLALVDAGIVRIPFGPAPVMSWDAGRWTISSTRLEEPCTLEVDWLCPAHVPAPAVDGSASALITSMRRDGWIRRHRRVAGLDLDADLHPIGADGRAAERLWVLGPLCEGATFYNHLVPSPGVYSRPIHDANRCVSALFEHAPAEPVHGKAS